MTLQDVSLILHLSILKEHVNYDHECGYTTIQRSFKHEEIIELGVEAYEIYWDVLAYRYKQFIMFLCNVIRGIMIPNHQGHGFPIRWKEMLIDMMTHGTMYVWVPCLLAMLYFHLHDVKYRGAQSIIYGTTLLMIRAWEHIAMF